MSVSTLAGLLLLGGVWYVSLSRVFYQNDFRAYWVAVRAAHTGLDPYLNNADHGSDYVDAGWRGSSSRFIYPPTALLLLAPFGYLPYNVAKICFSLVLFAGLLFSMLALYKQLEVDAVWIVLLAASPPTLANFDRGQIDLLILALVLLPWLCRSAAVGGAGLATAGLLKAWPLLLLLWLVANHKYRILAWMLVFLALGVGMSVTLWPAHYYREFYQTIFHPNSDFLPSLANVPYGGASFTVQGKVYLDKLWLFSSWSNPLAFAGHAAIPLALLVLVVGIIMMRRQNVPETISYFAAIFLTLAANLRLWPMGFVLYFPLCAAIMAGSAGEGLTGLLLVAPLFLPIEFGLGILRLPATFLALLLVLWHQHSTRVKGESTGPTNAV